jgi:FGGY-family pentulose kinase
MADRNYFLGVDVGTGSVRAALFDNTGKRLALKDSPIKLFRPQDNFVEQSSVDIWENTCKVVRRVIQESGIAAEKINGLGFDATCSLVALGENFKPVSLSPTTNEEQNIILWMDHRAEAEAEEINRTGDEVLRYVGGKISPEMEIPKLLWLKRHLPGQYNKTLKFLDLPDFLVFRACGSDVRSVCTNVCKWTYLAHEKRWSKNLFKQIDLEDLFDNNRLGTEIKDLGTPAGRLSEQAAGELALTTKTVVATAIIDAHAGGIGLLKENPESTLALISGTSSCHMAVNKKPLFVPGVWGPYYGAMLPGYWLNEGGQSATGALLDHVIEDSAVYQELKKQAQEENKTVYELLNDEVNQQIKKEDHPTQDFHLLGYFHGNRSPRADPHLKGMISGLSLNRTKTELAKRYLAAIQSVAYGTRHIIETLNKNGHKISKINMCGGGTRNSLWLKEHADITGCEIQLPQESEAVLLGSAILGAAASGAFDSTADAAKAMVHTGEIIKPQKSTRIFHDKKYRVFLEMYNDQVKYKDMMANQ